MSFKSYTEINSWQQSSQLFREVYFLFKNSTLLQREYALKDQIIRAALSIMNNIAEGFGRFSNRDFLRFLNIARGSCYEVESMIHAMLQIELLEKSEANRFFEMTRSIHQSLGGLSKYLSTNL